MPSAKVDNGRRTATSDGGMAGSGSDALQDPLQDPLRSPSTNAPTKEFLQKLLNEMPDKEKSGDWFKSTWGKLTLSLAGLCKVWPTRGPPTMVDHGNAVTQFNHLLLSWRVNHLSEEADLRKKPESEDTKRRLEKIEWAKQHDQLPWKLEDSLVSPFQSFESASANVESTRGSSGGGGAVTSSQSVATGDDQVTGLLATVLKLLDTYADQVAADEKRGKSKNQTDKDSHAAAHLKPALEKLIGSSEAALSAAKNSNFKRQEFGEAAARALSRIHDHSVYIGQLEAIDKVKRNLKLLATQQGGPNVGPGNALQVSWVFVAP